MTRGVGALARGATCLLAATALAACGVIPAPPGPLEADFVPEITAEPASEVAMADGFTREQHLAVRIRVETCTGWSSGSGWVLSSNEVVTNRHVVEGATRIEVTTHDGRDFVVHSSVIAPVADLALLTLDDVFTETATVEIIEPSAGDELSIVGYPLGQALTVENGVFVALEQDTLGEFGGEVWFINAHIEHGSSGSPVYDANGDVVAIVYAGDEAWDAIAWPASSLQELLDDPSTWTANTATC